MNLETLGWNNFFEAYFAPYHEQGLLAGRITIQHKERYIISTEQGEMGGHVSGKFRFETTGLHDFPAVGDWVAMDAGSADQPAIIHHVLERKSKFSRKVAGERSDEQIIAANIDVVMIVMGLDGNYNLRRLERYLILAWESGAKPVIILNKSDLCPLLEECIQEVLSIAQSIDVIVMSALRTEEVKPLHSILIPGITSVLLGSSGVGKSTIINQLLGEDNLKVQEVRVSDSHGRHTTAHRELFLLPTGGIIIDTPGLRELQLLGSEEGLLESFDDIEQLAANCRFRNCRHEAEPDCAVKKAIDDGTLDPGRYENFQKLHREIQHQATKYDSNAKQSEKEHWKKISKLSKKMNRDRDKP